MTPREAGIQAFYADESTTNTLQGLNAAFDAYEAAASNESLRDRFAGHALAGLIQGYAIAYGSPTNAPDEVVREAFSYADAMLAALSKAKEA